MKPSTSARPPNLSVHAYAVLDAVLSNPGSTTRQLQRTLAGTATPAAVGRELKKLCGAGVVLALSHGGAPGRHYISGLEDYAQSLEAMLRDAEQAIARIRRAGAGGTPREWARQRKTLSDAMDILDGMPASPRGGGTRPPRHRSGSRPATSRDPEIGEIRRRVRYGFATASGLIKRAEAAHRRLQTSQARVDRGLSRLSQPAPQRKSKPVPREAQRLWKEVVTERLRAEEAEAEIDSVSNDLDNLLSRGQEAAFGMILRRRRDDNGIVCEFRRVLELDKPGDDEEDGEYDDDAHHWEETKEYLALQQLCDEIKKPASPHTLASKLVASGYFTRTDAEAAIHMGLLEGRLAAVPGGLIILSVRPKPGDNKFFK